MLQDTQANQTASEIIKNRDVSIDHEGFFMGWKERVDFQAEEDKVTDLLIEGRFNDAFDVVERSQFPVDLFHSAVTHFTKDSRQIIAFAERFNSKDTEWIETELVKRSLDETNPSLLPMLIDKVPYVNINRLSAIAHEEGYNAIRKYMEMNMPDDAGMPDEDGVELGVGFKEESTSSQTLS